MIALLFAGCFFDGPELVPPIAEELARQDGQDGLPAIVDVGTPGAPRPVTVGTRTVAHVQFPLDAPCDDAIRIVTYDAGIALNADGQALIAAGTPLTTSAPRTLEVRCDGERWSIAPPSAPSPGVGHSGDQFPPF